MIEYKLEELLKIKNGRDYKHLREGSIPVYGSGGLMRYVNEALYEGKSILLPRKGTLSNIQYVNEAFWTVDTLYYSIVDESKAEPYYLYNYIKLLDLKHLNTGTGVPSMTFGAYYDVPIKLPNLSIQNQIAKVLSDLDAKIEINNKINQELEAMAKTLYDYWFVQFDFPDVNGLPYKSSGGNMVFNEELKREVPVGWKSGYLNDLYDFKYGLGNTNPHNGGEYPVYGSNGVIGSYDKFNNEDAPVIGHIGNKCGSLVYAFGKHYVTYNGVMCKIRKPYDKFFGYTTLLSKDLMSRRRGSSQPFISYDLLNDITFIIPEDRIMKIYCDLIIPSYEKVISNLKQNQKLSELRDWLLPMLMNGQVSVGYAEKEVESLGLVAEGDEEYKKE
jgi:type I restriction enzyme S subunit